MRWLLLGGLFAAVYLFWRRLTQANPTKASQLLRWFLAGLFGFLLLTLAARGGGALIIPLLLLLAPLLMRWVAMQQSAAGSVNNGNAASSPSESTVESRFLRMSLDHGSGNMRGTVVTGRFAGRELQDMSMDDLLLLWQECRSDPQSMALLEAYLDRTYGEEWHDKVEKNAQDRRSGARSGPISPTEAYAILGLQPGASREQIKAAHRRLMQRVHPDHGGSNYLAARINEAKDVLLG